MRGARSPQLSQEAVHAAARFQLGLARGQSGGLPGSHPQASDLSGSTAMARQTSGALRRQASEAQAMSGPSQVLVVCFPASSSTPGTLVVCGCVSAPNTTLPAPALTQ